MVLKWSAIFYRYFYLILVFHRCSLMRASRGRFASPVALVARCFINMIFLGGPFSLGCYVCRYLTESGFAVECSMRVELQACFYCS